MKLTFILLLLSSSFLYAQPNRTAHKGDFVLNNSATSITFLVDSVEIASELLDDTTLQMVFENRIDRPLMTIPEELKEVEVVPTYMNGFLHTVHSAYSEHRPIEIAPDDIWLLICQGFGQHLTMNAEKLKLAIFDKETPKEITVRNDELIGGDSKDWGDLIAGFSEQIDYYAKDEIVHLLVPEFSTTTPMIHTAYQVTLMESFKSYFTYRGESGCGIPNITLHGTTQDWEKIYRDIETFREFGLGEWVNELKPVLLEFMDASKGNINRPFWQSIYKQYLAYQSSAMSGWVIKFFPYLTTTQLVGEESMMEQSEFIETYTPNPFLKGKDYLFCDLGTHQFPKGFIKLDFIWSVLEKNKEIDNRNMLLYAGFVGMKQNHVTKSLRPQIAWGISQKEENESEWNDHRWGRSYYRDTMAHQEITWDPKIRTEVDILPIYHSEINDSYADGLSDFVAYLHENDIFSGEKSSIEFIVAWDGSVVNIEVSGPLKSKKDTIIKLIEDLPFSWTPAQMDHSDEDVQSFLLCSYKIVLTI